MPLYQFLFAIFIPVIDVVPAMVYYHAAQMIEAMKWEIGSIKSDSLVSNKLRLIHSIRSRFVALRVMVRLGQILFLDLYAGHCMPRFFVVQFLLYPSLIYYEN